MSTFREQPPRVRLVAFTAAPVQVVSEAFRRAKNMPLALTRGEQVEDFRRLLFDYTQIPEFVSFTWWLEGVPRAFFDQVVRHRKTSMFARSQRVERCTSFASEGKYFTPASIASSDTARNHYDRAMRMLEDVYSKLLEEGVPAEDARGVLPLHLHTAFNWGTTLRDLVDVFRTRTCHLLQQQYWAPIAAQMRETLLKVDPELDALFQPPCVRSGTCVSDFDATLRYAAIAEGRGNDLPVCRLHALYFADEAQRDLVEDALRSGATRYAESPGDVARSLGLRWQEREGE